MSLAALCAVACGSMLAVAPAFAETHRGYTGHLGEPGSGAGQMRSPRDVAVNDTTGDVYVADEGNNRVDEFEADGTFIRAWGLGVADGITEGFQTCTITCFGGIAEGGAFGEEQSFSPQQIAVDSSGKLPSEDPSVGDVYVLSSGSPAIDKFSREGEYLGQVITGSCEKAGETSPSCHGFVPSTSLSGIAVDPNGELWADGYEHSSGGPSIYSYGDALVNEFSSASKSQIGSNGTSLQLGLAVDSRDNLYAIYLNSNGDQEFTAKLGSNGAILDERVGGDNPGAVAVDLSNDVYIDVEGLVEVFNPALQLVETFGAARSQGMAVGSASGPIYVSSYQGETVDVFTLGETPKEAPKTTEPPAEIGPTSAKLEGELNPGGASGKLEYQFDFNTDGSCTGGQSAPVPAGEVANASKAAVSAKATGLQPGIRYTYCLVAFNPFGSLQGSEVSFETPKAAPEILGESTAAPRATEVTLQAQINPNNQETVPTFEYSTSEAEVLAGDGTKLAGATLNGYSSTGVAASVATGSVLAQNTTYYYRVTAKNASNEEAIGKVEHFTTAIPPETPETSSLKAEPIGGTTATLRGVLNPGHVGNPGHYEFLYMQSASECEGANQIATPATPALGGGGEAAQAPVGELLPNTTYTFCLRVSNEAGEEALSAPVTFTTLAEGPKVEEEWVTQVSATAATLQAKIDPRGAQTTYRFEYGTTESYGQSTPVSPGIGSDDTGHLASAYIQGLQAHTTYHYRVVANNAQSPAGSPGVDQTFTTWPAGSGFALPDDRAWELVSPPPGGNGATAPVVGIGEGGPVIQAAEDGGAITYGVLGSAEATPPGASNFSQVLSVRGADGGWSSREIATSREQASGVSIGRGQEYRYFSGNLSLGLVEPSVIEGLDAGDGALLSPAASEATLFVHADEPLSPSPLQQGPFSEAVAEGGYKALATSKPGYANVPAGTRLQEALGFEGATPDLSHVIIYSGVPLAATTPEGKTTKPSNRHEEGEGSGLYEWSAGRLELVSLLPNHAQAALDSLGNEDGNDHRGAVSSDGSRIFWTGRKPEHGQGGERQLYMRDVSLEQTVELDKNKGGPEGGPNFNPEFQFANSDGSKAFFTDDADLTAGSTARESSPDLYECEIEEVGAELECKLSDLTVDPGGHADVRGVVDVGSDEDTMLYFVARGELTQTANGRGEKAKVGEDNLYMLRHDEETKKWESPVFIDALSNEDEPDWSGNNGGGDLAGDTSRVSPDGRYLEFMSDRSLTGYDNRDAYSGAADEEVFLYDASTNRLVCASCNPTGERPVGVLSTVGGGPVLIDGQNLWRGQWLAANVPAWMQTSLSIAYDQPQYLSNEGRLFFNSPDELVSQATNGLANVYEYEPAGVGGCEASSVTFSERSDGCVGMISSGSSGEESVFVGASENGDDVFFLSSAQLTLKATTGSALDMYDAHVCSALAPCPVEAASPPPCDTEATCKAAPTPQPTIFGAGPSETFSGAGNQGGRETNQPPPAVKPKAKPAKCRRGYVDRKVKKKERCVKAKSKKKAKKATRAGYKRGAGR